MKEHKLQYIKSNSSCDSVNVAVLFFLVFHWVILTRVVRIHNQCKDLLTISTVHLLLSLRDYCPVLLCQINHFGVWVESSWVWLLDPDSFLNSSSGEMVGFLCSSARAFAIFLRDRGHAVHQCLKLNVGYRVWVTLSSVILDPSTDVSSHECRDFVKLTSRIVWLMCENTIYAWRTSRRKVERSLLSA